MTHTHSETHTQHLPSLKASTVLAPVMLATMLRDSLSISLWGQEREDGENERVVRTKGKHNRERTLRERNERKEKEKGRG